MPRAKSFDVDQALESAMLLFWRSGYEATSIQALERITGLTRTSLYNAFGNKRALFELALNRYRDVVISRFLDAISAAPTARAAVEAALEEAIALHFTPPHPGGCMVVLSLLESHQHDGPTRALLETTLTQLRDGFVGRFDHAMSESEISPAADGKGLADEAVAMIMGIIVMAKANVSRDRLRVLARQFAAGICPE